MLVASNGIAQCDIPGSIYSAGGSLGDQGHSVCFDQENSEYYLGDIRQISPSTGWDWVVQKRDINFNLLWEYSYGTSLDEMGDNFLVHPDGSGGCLLAGYESPTWRRMILTRLNSQGEVLWSRFLNTNTTNGETPACFVLGTNNDVMLVGTTNTYGAGSSDGFILSLDLDNGSTNWSKVLGLVGNQHIYTVKALPDGNYVAAGSAGTSGSSARDPWLLKFDSSGNIMNQFILPATGTSNSWIMDIAIGSDGFLYTTGAYSLSGEGTSRFYVSKLNSNLEILWSSLGPQNTAWFGSSILLTSDNQLFVIAASQEKSRLVELAESSGEITWVKEFINNNDQHSSIYGQNLVMLSDERLFWSGWIDSGTNSTEIIRYYANSCDQEDCFEGYTLQSESGPTNKLSFQTNQNGLPSFVNYNLVRTDISENPSTPMCEEACALQGTMSVPTHCVGDVIEDFLALNGLLGAESFQWTLNGQMISTSSDFFLDGSLAQGDYNLEVELSQSGSCNLYLADSFQIIGPPALLNLDDVISCGDTIILSSIYPADWSFAGLPTQVAFESGSYEFSTSNECGVTTESVLVSIIETSVSIAASDSLDCFTDALNLTIDPVLDNIAIIEWINLDDGNVIGNGTNALVTTAGEFAVNISLESGCTIAESITIGFNQNNPNIFLSNPDTIKCNVPVVQIELLDPPLNSSGIFWYNNAGQMIDSMGNVTIFADTAGTYMVEVHFPGGCVSSTSIEVHSLFETIEVHVPTDTLDCVTQLITLEASPINESFVYQWSSNDVPISNEVNISIDTPGDYSVTVVNPLSGCFGSWAGIISEDLSPPQFQLQIEEDSLSCSNPNIVVSANSDEDNLLQYSWRNDSEQIIGNSPNIIINEPGHYSVYATSPANGCIAMQSFELFQANEVWIDNSDIEFPNIISENNDGKNELWIPFHKSNSEFNLTSRFDFYEAKVYNRWGALLFDGRLSNNSPEYWAPKELEDGIFYFIAKYSTDCDPEFEVKEGHITMVR